MNLYLLKRIGATNYDQYDSMIYCAPNEEITKELSVEEYGGRSLYSPWINKEEIECTLIGKADNKIRQGLIISSYNAG